MKIGVIGATGFLGKEIVRQFVISDHQVFALTRTAGKANKVFGGMVEEYQWDGKDAGSLIPLLNMVDVIVNLAGEDISEKRWTKKRKQLIIESRSVPAQAIAHAIREAKKKPSHWIQASATGIYGTDFDGTGTGNPDEEGFLTHVCREWEKPAQELNDKDVNVSILRLGVVLGTEAGMLKKVLPLFKMFLGGHLGNGKQWMSWIHKSDASSAVEFIIENRLKGIFNITSPQPVMQKQFFKQLGEELHRPSWAHVPAFVLKLVFGEMAKETILSSVRILPDQLLEAGFSFKYPDLKGAFADLKSNSG